MTTLPTSDAYADSLGRRAMLEEKLETSRSTRGDLHSKTLSAKNKLGVNLMSSGSWAEARELFESTFNDARRTLGKHHSLTVTVMENFALALYEDGELERACTLQKKVLKRYCSYLGEEHTDTLLAMTNLAYTLFRLGELQQAQLLQESVLKIRRRTLGEGHPDTVAAVADLAATINNLAVDLRNAGDLVAAEPLQKKAVTMTIQANGDDSIDAAIVYSATGELLKRKGEIETSLRYFHKALKIREREFGVDAPLCQLVRTRMREMLH